MLRVGILGTGFMAHTHAAAWAGVRNARVVAVAGRTESRVTDLAEQLGARAIATPQALVEDDGLDAVDVCLPTDLHREFVTQAAAAGKHVFCEKPIARSLHDAEVMIAACRRAGVRLMVGHVVRFFPDYHHVWGILDSGNLGHAKIVRTTRESEFPRWGSDDWYANPARSGGPIVDLMIHDIDFIRWRFGPIRRVYARSLTDRNLRHLDYALMTMRLANGMMAHLEASWAEPAGAPFNTKLEIAGTGGLYQASLQDAVPLRIRTRDPAGKVVYEADSPLAKNPYQMELQAFVDAVLAGAEPPVTGEDAAAALRIALAGVESAATGRPVELGGDPQ